MLIAGTTLYLYIADEKGMPTQFLAKRDGNKKVELAAKPAEKLTPETLALACEGFNIMFDAWVRSSVGGWRQESIAATKGAVN